MSTTYALLLPGDESYWEGPDGASEGMARHQKFAALLAERGHEIVGGTPLSHSREARTVRGGTGELGSGTVTEGPYAESAEQITGFYLVQTDDLDSLVECCGVLSGPGHDVELRPVVDYGGDA